MPAYKRWVKGGLEYPALLLALLAALAMVAMVAIIVTSVISRKLFSMPLPFTEEFVGILMSVATCLGLALAVRATLPADTAVSSPAGQ